MGRGLEKGSLELRKDVPDRPPGLVRGDLRHPLYREDKDADLDVRLDAAREPGVHGGKRHPGAFDGSEGTRDHRQVLYPLAASST